MPKSPEATLEAAPSGAASSSPDPMLMDLLQGISGQIASFGTRLEALEARPEIGRVQRQDPMNMPALNLNRTFQPRPGGGAGVGDHNQIPHGADSHPVGPGSPRPRFRPGDLVTIREEVHHGTGRATKTRVKESDGTPAVDDEGRPVFERSITYIPWGEVLGPLRYVRCPRLEGTAPCPDLVLVNRHCPYCRHGPVVMSVEFMHEDGQWCYRVRVPGLTSTPYGEVLVDAEIEPA